MPDTPSPDPDETPPGMIGVPPSQRRPMDAARHAMQTAHEWEDVCESYVQRRMKELGVPRDMIGAEDPYRRKPWHTFDPEGTVGGNITTGITVNSGVLNPDLLKGTKGGKVWAQARLRNRIDAVIAHEYEEDRNVTHEKAVEAVPRTELTITDGARRILQAMAR